MGLLLSFTACSHWYEEDTQALAKKVSEETTEPKPDETNGEPPETPKIEPSCEEVRGGEKAVGGTPEKREGLHGEATEGVLEREKDGEPCKRYL